MHPRIGPALACGKRDENHAPLMHAFAKGKNILRIALPPDEAAALHRAAQSKGIKDTELVREWLSEKLQAS